MTPLIFQLLDAMELVANIWLAKLLLVERTCRVWRRGHWEKSLRGWGPAVGSCALECRLCSEDVDQKHPKEVEPEKERGASNTITFDKLLCDGSRVTNVLRRMAHG